MDVNLNKMVQELRESLQEEESSRNNINIEKCFLEFKTELYMKREEVKQTRIHLELANNEIIELKEELDNTNKQCEEKKFSLNILLKKSKTLEEELNNNRETLLKIQMQYKMTVGELHTLKEKLHKIEAEKNDLSRKVEFFETKQRHNSVYQGEMLKRDNSLRSAIEEINSNLVKLKTEQQKVQEMSSESKLAGESIKKLRIVQKNYEVLKKEKLKLEGDYIKINAKHDLLEHLLLASNQNLYKPNLITKIVFAQWHASQASYQKDMKEKNELLANLCEQYEQEKSINVKLIFQTEELRSTIKKLEQNNENLHLEVQKFTDKKSNEQTSSVETFITLPHDEKEIKTEIIEIDDS